MTKITYDPDSYCIDIQGHAGSAVRGEDLVCAAVSILMMTLEENAMSRAEFSPSLYLNPNQAKVVIRCRPDEEYEQECRYLMEIIMRGFELLAEHNPDYVQITGGYDGKF